jgi:hypothetical protein
MYRNRLFQLLIAVALIVSAVGGYAALTDSAEAAQQPEVQVLKFDIAEDGNRFAFDEEPVFEDGMPAYGNSFVTEGYIYPEGTLNGSNGVLENGEPEFPELVLGRWTCYGWFVNEGGHSTTGPMVITTQIFDLGEAYGDTTIVTDGYELADFNVSVKRAITGGTGEYVDASGEAVQELLGFTEQMGVNIRYELRISE